MRSDVRRRLPGLWLGVIVLVAGLPLACNNRQTSDKNLVFVGADDAASLVHGRRKLLGGTVTGVWVDPRSEREYRAGHIPGAIHLPLEEVQTRHTALRKYAVVVVYGNDYNSPVARAMSKALIEAGYDDVRTLRGGLRAWESAGNGMEESD